MFRQFLHRARVVVCNSYESHPQMTNGVTGFITFSFGDVLSQKILKFDNTIDYERAVKTGALGLFMNGLVLHHWYNALDRIFGRTMQCKKTVFMKTAADQLLYAPFSIAIFFGFASAVASSQPISFMHSTSSSHWAVRKNEFLQSFYKKMESDFASVFLADCCLWPFVNIVNFSCIPKNYRSSFIGIAQLVWQTYISSMGHSAYDSVSALEPLSRLQTSVDRKNSG